MTLHSVVLGDGARKALALHCTLAHSGVWRGVARRLEGVSVTALDLPGHGQSAPWDGQGDLTDAVLAGVLEHVTEPVDLIGHSYGGVVALLVALERPEMVRSLSLYEPVLMVAGKEAAPDVYQQNFALMEDVEAHIRTGDQAMAARLFLRAWGDGRPWDSLPEDMREMAARLVPFIVASGPALEEDRGRIIPRLGQIKVPVLIMDGAESPPLMAAVQGVLASRIPQARRVHFEGLGHMGPISHPGRIAAEIAKTIG